MLGACTRPLTSERKGEESKTTADKSRPHVIPFNKGIKVLSYREALEVTENYGEVMTWSDEERIPILFERGHGNLGRGVAKHFETVLHCGVVTEIIPRRRGFLYKITYEDGDQEDMDEDELILAIQLRKKKHRGEDVTEDISNEAEVLSGLSEEGSVYDSEEDRKALKEAKKKRKAVVAMGAARTTAKKKAAKWTVCPESVANVGGSESMLGKTLTRYK